MWCLGTYASFTCIQRHTNIQFADFNKAQQSDAKASGYALHTTIMVSTYVMDEIYLVKHT